MGRLLAEIRELQLQDELTTPVQARKWVKMKIQSVSLRNFNESS